MIGLRTYPEKQLKLLIVQRYFARLLPNIPDIESIRRGLSGGGEWICLEISIDIAEFGNSKAELEEGVIMIIIIFNLPKGEEEPIPDNDREADPPDGDKPTSRSRSEEELRNEAISEHLFSHRPKNHFYPLSQKAKIFAP